VFPEYSFRSRGSSTFFARLNQRGTTLGVEGNLENRIFKLEMKAHGRHQPITPEIFKNPLSPDDFGRWPMGPRDKDWFYEVFRFNDIKRLIYLHEKGNGKIDAQTEEDRKIIARHVAWRMGVKND